MTCLWCRAEMTVRKGAHVCDHCDRPHESRGCPTCKALRSVKGLPLPWER